MNGILPSGRFLGDDDPHNFSELGGKFLYAAKVLNREYKNAPEWPTLFLIFQSLELYLKSYLVLKGKTVDYIKYTIGHKLFLALVEAKNLGLPVPTDSDYQRLEEAIIKFR